MALARDLLLVEQTGVRAHFSQITSARGAQMIAEAQARGLPVSADVALYQLILTDEALAEFSSLYHVQPPLRTRADRDGLARAGAARSAPSPATTSPTRKMPSWRRSAPPSRASAASS